MEWRLKSSLVVGPRGYPVLTEEIRRELDRYAKAGKKTRYDNLHVEVSSQSREIAGTRTVGVCTRVKNRLKRLQRVLPSVLKQQGLRFGYVIIDYGCGDGTAQWVKENVRDPRVLVVKLCTKNKYFKYAHAWNVGIKHIAADIGLALDVDVELLSDTFLVDSVARMEEWDYYWLTTSSTAQRYMGGAGTTFFHKWLFDELNGFCEAGDVGAPCGEDGNMWGRCGRANSCQPDKSGRFRGRDVEVFAQGGATKWKRGIGSGDTSRRMKVYRRKVHIWRANLDIEPGAGKYELWAPGLELTQDATPFWTRIRGGLDAPAD